MNFFPTTTLPASTELSVTICNQHLPSKHPVPEFFRIRDEAVGREVGATELKEAYDRVHDDYDGFWLSAAATPIDELVQKLTWHGTEGVFEAGCGTGYATVLLAKRAAKVLAVDLSEGMQSVAKKRLRSRNLNNVQFLVGDALTTLSTEGSFDRIFSSWVLGYIPLVPFFEAAGKALAKGGQLAFIVHRENSPREPLEIFAEIVAEDPSVLQKQVAFDFPRNAEHIRSLLVAAGFGVQELYEGSICFCYSTAQAVLDHLLKSGAGTAFYDALDPTCREQLIERFLDDLVQRHTSGKPFEVRHEFIACIANKSSIPDSGWS